MAEITAAMVKDLREKTGAGMMDCKAALNETKGDMEAAIDWLRKKGLSKAAKKAGRTAAEGLDLGLDLGRARQDHDRGVDLADAQLTQNLKAVHIGQVQIQHDHVVVIDLAEIDALFSEVRRVDVEPLGLEHEFDALRGRMIIFDKQDAHSCPSRQNLTVISDIECRVTLFGS